MSVRRADTEFNPEFAGLEDDLKGRKIKAMIYTVQAIEPAVVPVVGVTETGRPNATRQSRLLGRFDGLDKALAVPTN